jgi:hypothetical protein
MDLDAYGEVRPAAYLGANLCSSFIYSIISSNDFFSSIYMR